MSTIAWVWLAAFGGFLLGWFLCLMLTRDRSDEEERDDEEYLERIFRL